MALAAVVLIESCGRHIAFVCENVAARNVPSAQAESDTDGAPNDRYRAAADENAGVLARPGRPRRRRLRRPLLDTAVIAGWLTQSELAKPGTAERNERRGWRCSGQQSRLSKGLGRLCMNAARVTDDACSEVHAAASLCALSAANPVVCRWHGERIVMWRRGRAGCSLSVDRARSPKGAPSDGTHADRAI